MSLRLFEWLREKVAFGETYSEADRCRDFRRTFMETPHGRRVFHQLTVLGYVFTPTLVAGDPDTTRNNEGRRALMLDIIDILDTPEGPPDVQTEEGETA